MRGLVGFLLFRVLSASVTLLGLTLVVFTAMHLIPGDFTEVLVPRGTPEFRKALAERLGLDGPLYWQYLTWLKNLVSGDFGASLITSQPVWKEFAGRLPVTMELAVLSVATSIAIGAPLGLISGLAGTGRFVSAISRVFCGFTVSLPDFFLGTIFLYVFSKYALGLTVGDFVPLSVNPEAHFRGMALPVLSLSLLGIGTVAAVTRETVFTLSDQDYVFAATVRGRSMSQIVRRHFVRNASVPLLTVISIYLGYLLGGSILIEQLFSLPGIGRYIFQAVQARDYPVVQAGVVMIAAAFVLTNMLTDIAYGVIDPRMRAGHEH
ncbi:MAG TPA: ABC transporter permease [Nitrospira sp.]|nr:ABC transporter permease [Nitrospira sp.]